MNEASTSIEGMPAAIDVAGPSQLPAAVQPSATLYVKNINTKIKKREVQLQLYALCSTYGKVLDVVATRATGMRGQAFVVFRDIATATTALRSLNGFTFYGRPIALTFARSPSKATIAHTYGPEALTNPGIISEATKANAEIDDMLMNARMAFEASKKRPRDDATVVAAKRNSADAQQKGSDLAEEESSSEENSTADSQSTDGQDDDGGVEGDVANNEEPQSKKAKLDQSKPST